MRRNDCKRRLCLGKRTPYTEEIKQENHSKLKKSHEFLSSRDMRLGDEGGQISKASPACTKGNQKGIPQSQMLMRPQHSTGSHCITHIFVLSLLKVSVTFQNAVILHSTKERLKERRMLTFQETCDSGPWVDKLFSLITERMTHPHSTAIPLGIGLLKIG